MGVVFILQETVSPGHTSIMECTHTDTSAPLPGTESRCELGPLRLIITVSINQLTNSSKLVLSWSFYFFCLESARQLQGCMMTLFYLFYLSFLVSSLEEPQFMLRFVSLQVPINHPVCSWNGARSQIVRQQLVALIGWDSSRATTSSAN